MIRRLLMIIALALVATPSLSSDLANGDVLFCTSDFFYGAEGVEADAKRYKSQNLRVNISQNLIKFGGSGYFKNTSMNVKKFKSWEVVAQDEYSTFVFGTIGSKISFYYAGANPFGMAFMRGNCDKF